MIAFEIETGRFDGYIFVDLLIIRIDNAVFGLDGTPAVKGLVVNAIESMIENIERQQRFPGFLQLLSSKPYDTLFAILDDACWGSGNWRWPGFDVPEPYVFLALPAATELFDAERAYFFGSTTGRSRIVYKNLRTKIVDEVNIDSIEYLNAWNMILEKVKSAT